MPEEAAAKIERTADEAASRLLEIAAEVADALSAKEDSTNRASVAFLQKFDGMALRVESIDALMQERGVLLNGLAVEQQRIHSILDNGLSANVRLLTRRSALIEKRQAAAGVMLASLSPLADAAPGLIALKQHSEALARLAVVAPDLARLATYAPAIEASIAKSSRNEIFTEELWKRMGSKAFVLGVITVIVGAIASALAAKYFGILR